MRLLSLCVAILLTMNAGAQKFSHELGASVSFVFWTEKTVYERWAEPDIVTTESASVVYPMLTYSPRYDFAQLKNSSFSVSAPVSLGGGLATNYATDDLGFAFTYDLPVVVDYNFGRGSLPGIEKKMGGYFGGGFSYQYFSISGSIASDIKKTTYGPLMRGGVRFKKITLGLYFRPGLEKPGYTTFGINTLGKL